MDNGVVAGAFRQSERDERSVQNARHGIGLRHVDITQKLFKIMAIVVAAAGLSYFKATFESQPRTLEKYLSVITTTFLFLVAMMFISTSFLEQIINASSWALGLTLVKTFG